MRPEIPRPRKWAVYLVLLVSLPIAAELGVRLLAPWPPTGAPYALFYQPAGALAGFARFELPISDPLLGWVRDAPFREYVSRPVPETERALSFAASAGKGVRRVVALGGSTTDPNLVEKNWVYRLAEHCDEAGIRCRLLNGGVTGYNTNQEVLKLLRDVLPLKPDLVISLSGVNDEAINDRSGHTFVNAQQPELEAAIRRGAWEAGSPLSVRPPIAGPFPYLRLLARELAYRLRPDAAVALVHEPADGMTRAERWETNMRTMHAVAEEFGVHYLMVLQPHLALEPNRDDPTRKAFAFAMDEARVRSFYDAARAACRRVTYCLDLSDVLYGHGEEFRDTVHVREEGHAREAERIFAALRQRRLL